MSRNLDSEPIDASRPLGEAWAEGGRTHERSQGILAGCGRRRARARRVRQPTANRRRSASRSAAGACRSSTCTRTACSPKSRSACRASTRRASRRRRSCSAPSGSRPWTSAASTSRRSASTPIGGTRRTATTRAPSSRRTTRASPRGAKQHPDALRRLVAPSRCSFPISRPSSSSTRSRILGARGASIGGHVNNEPPTSEKYDPFWAKAEELGVPVFMHPNNALNIARDGALDGRGGLRQHRRQSARDDGVLEPHDLRRHARPFPAPQGLRRARRRLLAVVSRPQRCRVRRARRRELRQQAQAERVLQGSDRRRLDGVLVGRVCATSSPRRA